MTIQGELFAHMLCHVVLPYSNWGWLTVCQSESMLALRRGIPAALAQLGRIPRFSQTDNSTSATHKIAAGEAGGSGGHCNRGRIATTHGTGNRKPRAFNNDYWDMMVGHYDIQVRTIGVGKSEQNGDVEASNNALKRRLYQHLLLRGHKDFPSVEAWEAWAQDVCRLANARRKGVEEELAAMRPLRVEAFAEFDEWRIKVSEESTLLVKRNTYSVPAEARRQVRAGPALRDDPGGMVRRQATAGDSPDPGGGQDPDRLPRRGQVDAQEAGCLCPLPVTGRPCSRAQAWHQALEALQKGLGERKGEVAYLRNLNLAAEEMECDVEAALVLLMEAGIVPEPERVKELMGLVQAQRASGHRSRWWWIWAAFDALLTGMLAEAV